MRATSPKRQSPALRQTSSPMTTGIELPREAGLRSPGRVGGQRAMFDALMPPEPTRSFSDSQMDQQRAGDDALSTMTSRSVISRAQTTQSRRDGMPTALMGERESIHRTLFSQLQQLPKPHSQGLLMGAWLLLIGRNSFLTVVADDSDEEGPTAPPSSARLPSVKFAVDITQPGEDAASPNAKVNPLQTPPEAGLSAADSPPEDENSDDHNTAIFVPLPVILVILAIFLYCCVVVFWFPSSRPYNKGSVNMWSGGYLESVEAAVPFAAVAFYTIALAYANALGITFLRIEKQHVMDKRFVRQLRGKSITFGSKEAVQILETVNSKSMLVSRKVVEKLRQGQRDQVPADVYARYISSMASFKARRQLKNDFVTGVMIIVTPLLIALAPWLPRLAAGGAIWGQAEVEEIAMSILGPVLTFLCLNSIGTMMQTHAQTLSYHRERVARVACALPDPISRYTIKSWPTIPFDTILNVTLWNRVRWALSFPPNALHRWGTLVFDMSFVVVMSFFSIVALTSIFSRPTVVFDGTMALMITLLLTYFPISGYMLHVACETTMLEEGNREVLCRILLQISRTVINSKTTADQRHVQINKTHELRAAIRDVTSSVADQLHPVRFLGRPVTAATFLTAALCFLGCLQLAVLRAAFATQMLPSL
jgi:hypothetical protein